MTSPAVYFGNYTEKCSDNQIGVDCYREWYDGRGYVLRHEYRGCEYSVILLPGFELLPQALLAVIYGGFLIYLFFGVNLATEYFMRGVEQVAYAGYTKTVTDPDTGEEVKIRVTYWNEQVSTLTLIAAGSSAPEIVLATMGAIFTLGKPPDQLGPGTIVGTAAYNSLVITAAVLMFCPKDKPKKIVEVGPYVWTTIVAIWTYIWLMLVYKFISPDEIELWEAIVTLIQQIILVVAAYYIDRQPWRWSVDDYYLQHYKKLNAAPAINVVKVEVFSSQGQTFVADKSKLAIMLKDAKEKDPKFDEDLFVEEFLDKVSKGDRALGRLKARINARQVMGGGAVFPWKGAEYLSPVHVVGRPGQPAPFTASATASPTGATTPTVLSPVRISVHPEPEREPLQQYIGFARTTYSVLESAGSVKVAVKRWGAGLTGSASVGFYTKDGTATDGTDYTCNMGTLFFAAHETLQYITIAIIDDTINEPDKEFTVHLVSARPGSAPPGKPANVIKLADTVATVTIIDNDDPGVVGFTIMDVDATNLDNSISIEVSRRAGASGEVTLDYYTTDNKAVAGRDYDASKGQISLEHGQVSTTIKIPLKASIRPGIAFYVDIANPTGGAKLGISRCTVHVEEHPAVGAVAIKLARGFMLVRERLSNSAADYSTQFREAFTPGGGSGDDTQQVSWSSLFLHYICSTIKIILAFLPPPTWGGGWPCLFFGLVAIGCFTYLLGETASLFGCTIGFSDYLTALVFVAAGTSLPDTFASVIAIRDMPSADAALGNITGSNAVNVFVGLGLPWIIAAGYYTAKGEKYVTPAKSIAFTVVIFNCVNAVAVVLIFLQRFMTGYEVNTTFYSRVILPSILMALLALFLALAGVEEKGEINGF